MAMTTQALLETALAYPLAIDIFAYNDLLTGYNIVKANSNVLTELDKRDDLKECLAEQIIKSRESADPIRGDFPFLMLYMGVLSAVYDVPMNDEQPSDEPD